MIAAPVPALQAANDEVAAARQRLDAQFRLQLDALAEKCVELGLPQQAETTRNWFIRRDPSRLYVFLPVAVDRHKPPADAEQVVQQWYARFMQYRAAQADGLYALAKQAFDAGDPALAYRLAHEALHENPDHEQAQNVVYGGPAQRRSDPRPRVRKPAVRHPQLDWAPRRYWVVETEHYRLFTDHSQSEGVQAAQRLEELYDAWKQLFFRYWGNEWALGDRFAGGDMSLGRSMRHKVALFRDRNEYVSQLQKDVSQIDITSGIYFHQQEMACFYVDDASTQATWMHEGGHQLFYELGDAVSDVGAMGAFWIVEGAALYLESLQKHDGYYTSGGIDAPRLQYARYHAANQQFYMPLAQLCRLDQQSLQRHEEISRLYSQAAGLTQFLMHADDGRYRAALVDYVKLTHQGRADASTLAALTKTDTAELDQQYHHFLNVTDDALAQIPEPQNIVKLSLGHTSVGDAGLARLAAATKLEWLDLAYTEITDAGIAHLKNATSLRQLNLEHTQASEKVLDVIADFRNLEELDLSGLPIGDAGLEKIAQLQKLKVLWLTKTQVTDAGLAHLRGLKNLEMLDIAQTRVTSQGLTALKKSLPKLAE